MPSSQQLMLPSISFHKISGKVVAIKVSSRLTNSKINKHARALVRFSLLYVLLMSVVYSISKDLGHSPLFDSDRNSKELLIAIQGEQARRTRALLSGMRSNASQILRRLSSSTCVEFLFLIMTRSSEQRDRYLYLSRTVVKLLPILLQDNNASLAVASFGNFTAQLETLSEFVPVKNHTFNRTDPASSDEYLRHQILDYANFLRDCEGSRATYCVMMEDDALCSSLILKVLRYVLGSLLETRRRFGMVKLFMKEEWMGFGLDVIHEIFFISILSGLLSFVLLLACRSRLRKCSLCDRLLGSFVLAVAISFVAVAIGRPYWIQLRKPLVLAHALVSPSPAASNVGILFPRQVVEPLRRALLEEAANLTKPVEPVDVLVGKQLEASELPTYLVVPNLIEHIGFFSTSTSKQRDWREHFGVWTP